MPMKKKDKIKETLKQTVKDENNHEDIPNIIQVDKQEEDKEVKHTNIQTNKKTYKHKTDKENMHLTAIMLSDKAYEKLIEVALKEPPDRINAGIPTVLSRIVERMLQEFSDLDDIEPADYPRKHRLNVYISEEAKRKFRFMRLARRRNMSELIDSYIINHLKIE